MKHANRNSSVTASNRLRDKLAETGENLVDVGHIAKAAVQEKLVKLKNAASDGMQAGKDRMLDIEHGFEERVRERPIKYLLVAAGIGAVLGLFFRRS